MKNLASVLLIVVLSIAVIMLYPAVLRAWQWFVGPIHDLEPEDENDPGEMPFIPPNVKAEDMASENLFTGCPDGLVGSFCPINHSDDASTANFALWEFHSKDGTPVPKCIRGNVQMLMNNLQELRDHLGAPIHINSGYRSPVHNANVGGASQSRHLCGQAADIRVTGFTPAEVAQAIQALINAGRMQDGGLKAYPSFVHYDTGPARRW